MIVSVDQRRHRQAPSCRRLRRGLDRRDATVLKHDGDRRPGRRAVGGQENDLRSLRLVDDAHVGGDDPPALGKTHPGL